MSFSDWIITYSSSFPEPLGQFHPNMAKMKGHDSFLREVNIDRKGEPSFKNMFYI